MKNKAIFKYDLEGGGSYGKIMLPVGAEILSAQMQGQSPVMWALVDPEELNTEARRFHTIGTGHHHDFSGMGYIGTYQDGGLVWHVFEDLN